MLVSEDGSTRASRRNGRRVTVATIVVASLLLAVLAAAAFDPGTSISTRQLTRSDEAGGEAREQRVEFHADAEAASTVIARSHDSGWGRAIQVIIERPRPALQSLSVHLGTDAAGLAPNDVMLATPSGDWPAFRYDTSDNNVQVTAENIDWTSTAQLWFYVPSPALGDGRPEQLTVTVDLEQTTTPSLAVWQGTATFELPLADSIR